MICPVEHSLARHLHAIDAADREEARIESYVEQHRAARGLVDHAPRDVASLLAALAAHEVSIDVTRLRLPSQRWIWRVTLTPQHYGDVVVEADSAETALAGAWSELVDAEIADAIECERRAV